MKRAAAGVVAVCAVALTGGSATAAAAGETGGSQTARAAAGTVGRAPAVQIGQPKLAAPGATAAESEPVLLVPVSYPLHMKARPGTVRVELLGRGRRVIGHGSASASLSAGLEPAGVDRRSGFTHVHAITLPAARVAAELARAGAVTVRVRTSAVLDIERDGRAEQRSDDVLVARARVSSGGRLLCATPPLTYVKRGAAVTQRYPRCSAPVGWTVAAGPAHGSVRRVAGGFTYRAGRSASGWDGLTLRARPARRERTATAAAAAAVTVPAVMHVGSGTASTTRVRAIGDSITAGFGWYFNGAAMTIERLFGCRPGSPLNDACSSNSLTASNTAPMRYAPDYGLSNRIAWPAQWAARYGITDFANYAVTGSAPSDWLPGGAFYPQLRAAEAAAPDYLVFTLGANPLLSNVLFGTDTMECALWSDLFGNFTDCVMRAFARVNLQGNLKALYAHLLANTPSSTRIVAMQYYTAVPSVALAYSSQQLERMSELLDQTISQTVAAAGSSRLTTIAPPRFDVGIDMQPLYPSRFSCGGSFVDGQSNQSSATQWELWADPLRTFCSGPPWIISSDTGIHPNVAGHAQIASALPVP